jgi:hypothetical protein
MAYGRSPARELSEALSASAEAVCRHYLSNGRRSGRYWRVGDVTNSPGRSLFVRIQGGKDRGHWRDAATGEHGDLLDLICLREGFATLGQAMAEARRFLNLPQAEFISSQPAYPRCRSPSERARRLYARTVSLDGTHGAAYLAARGIVLDLGRHPLRFHPSLMLRDEDGCACRFPGLVAAVTDTTGNYMAVQRLFLDPKYPRKAAIADPRRALGPLLGHAVRFGDAGSVLVVGEGLETVLSIRCALPHLPVAAAGSAAHLAAFIAPAGLTRLYIACDNDRDGRRAADTLARHALAMGVASVWLLIPRAKDFNDDLAREGAMALRRHLLPQLAPDDRNRVL